MAFEVFQRSSSGRPPRPRGSASIDRRGRLAFSAADWAAVGGHESAIMLIDRDLLRIGLRPARDSEPCAFSLHLTTRKGRPRMTLRTSIRGILRELKLEVAKVAGHLSATTKGDILTIQLADLSGRHAALTVPAQSKRKSPK